ncbi:hypothetical protein [Nonomuraea fuscirosea]|uniref:hypothetical protein n=1 Tax=Nonomuraea fuscirosea TaxID=1291556 RepID=UPI00340A95AB
MLIDKADAAADAAGMAFVEQYRPRLHLWWLMYSLRRRRLVAFYQGDDCPPPGLVVEAAHPDELLKRMNNEAQALWISRQGRQPLLLAGSFPGSGGARR